MEAFYLTKRGPNGKVLFFDLEDLLEQEFEDGVLYCNAIFLIDCEAKLEARNFFELFAIYFSSIFWKALIRSWWQRALGWKYGVEMLVRDCGIVEWKECEVSWDSCFWSLELLILSGSDESRYFSLLKSSSRATEWVFTGWVNFWEGCKVLWQRVFEYWHQK